ncbi:MAG: hypothetical protein C5B50_02255 [Verrucomicrobia bacterium]|nr:MAG: hypothetical protein C5B50_02255 [Verrucomicrobiota bacterium]
MSKRVKNPEDEHLILVAAAARMRGDGKTQAQIAKKLIKSQPEVSRLIADAVEHDFLARSPAFLSWNVKQSIRDEVDRRYYVPEKLRNKLRDLAPAKLYLDVHLLPDGDDAFAEAAAECVVDLLRHSQVAGIMYGRTLERMVSRVKGCVAGRSKRESHEIQCIPLCGDPVHLMNRGQVNFSASHLAAQLGNAVRNEDSDGASQPALVLEPALAGVPAYFGRKFYEKDKAAAGWRKFVEEIPGYRAIFGRGDGRERAWIARLDTVISGAGIIAKNNPKQTQNEPPDGKAALEKTGDFIIERLKQEEDLVSESGLAKLIYGDMGGWLIARPNLKASDQSIVEQLNKGWTGIDGKALGEVAKSARSGGAPGVILVAAGKAKADMVREIVRQGLVNVLLIDLSLGTALS